MNERLEQYDVCMMCKGNGPINLTTHACGDCMRVRMMAVVGVPKCQAGRMVLALLRMASNETIIAASQEV